MKVPAESWSSRSWRHPSAGPGWRGGTRRCAECRIVNRRGPTPGTARAEVPLPARDRLLQRAGQRGGNVWGYVFTVSLKSGGRGRVVVCPGRGGGVITAGGGGGVITAGGRPSLG